MKKRIISLILVVVMSLLALSGCAYSYEEDDMTNYASFDSAAFLAALQALDIEEHEFGTDEEKRWLKVEDAILSTIASKATDKTKKITEGKVGAYDILYYSYFYTVTVGEGEEAKTFYFDTNKLTEASSSLQLGLSTNKEGELAGEIQKAFANVFPFVKDNSETADKNETNYYVTSKSGTVTAKEGGWVAVNVTYKVAEKDAEGTGTAVKHTNETIMVPYTKVEEGTDVTTLTFEQQLYGKTVGSQLETITVKVDENNSKVYTEVTINFTTNITNNSDVEPIVIENDNIKYEKKESDKDDTKVTDAFGNETTVGALNGQKKVYYVFPCYYIDVEEELTIDTLLYKIFGEKLSSSSLGMFGSDSDYKNGDDAISTLVSTLATKIKAYNTADTANTTANTTYETKLTAARNLITGEGQKEVFDGLVEDALNKYEAKKAATGDAVTAAKEAYDAAYKALTDYLNGTESGITSEKANEFKTAYDAKLAAQDKLDTADKERTEAKDKVLGCLGSKDAMAREILNAYKNEQYDSLDAEYRNDVIESVAHEIIHLAQEYIKYNGKYPEKALKDAIKRVENELKSNFYTGKYSGTDTTLSGKTNYVAFEGSYDKYAISALELSANATKDDINAAIRTKAETAIKDVILVYTLVDCLNDNGLATIGITEEEEKNIKTQISSSENVREYDLKAALMLDKVFNYFMAVRDRGEKPSKVYKPATGTSDAYELYLEQMAKYNAVNFKNVKIGADAE